MLTMTANNLTLKAVIVAERENEMKRLVIRVMTVACENTKPEMRQKYMQRIFWEKAEEKQPFCVWEMAVQRNREAEKPVKYK